MTYLILNPPKGNGFNQYEWGGYLIGKRFPAKVFIYGAMTLWKNETYNPFEDYVRIVGKDDQAFIKHNFTWVLIQGNSDLAQKLSTTTLLGNWKLEYYDGIYD